MRTRLASVLVATFSVWLVSASAMAHVSVSGPAYAGQNALLSVNVGHGCEGADTVALEVDIPKEITSLRVAPSAFANVELVRDSADIVTKIVWTFTTETRDMDEMYYQLTVRARMPEAAFSSLSFPATQTCKDADGNETTHDWRATPEEIAEAPEGMEPSPAAMITVLPAPAPGWNKWEAPVAITDLSVFDGAEIVWVGDSAYSANPAIAEMIADDAEVSELTEIEAGAEIWAKY